MNNSPKKLKRYTKAAIKPFVKKGSKLVLSRALNKVGASFKRDTLDERIIQDVVNKKGKIIDVQGNYPHGTDFELTKQAWPNLKMQAALIDSDEDGMPDSWETEMKLNPYKADASLYTLSKLYTNIEMYINAIAP
jgi:hypothetical protein